MEESIWTLLGTNIVTGGLSWLFTLKFTRKEAEAGAMAKMQEVYERLIGDLQSDREKLKEQIGAIEAKCDEDRKEFNAKVDSLEKKIRKNEEIFRSVRPSACALAKTCREFRLIEIHHSNDEE